MARDEASRWTVGVILVVSFVGCGGETTGVARHIDLGGDASVHAVDAASSPSCPTKKPTNGDACDGSPTYVGSTCNYGSETCRCVNVGQNSVLSVLRTAATIPVCAAATVRSARAAFRSEAERATEFRGERAHDLGAEPSVVAKSTTRFSS